MKGQVNYNMTRNVTKNIEEFEKAYSVNGSPAQLKTAEMLRIINYANSRLSEDSDNLDLLLNSVQMAWNAGYQTGYKAGKRNKQTKQE